MTSLREAKVNHQFVTPLGVSIDVRFGAPGECNGNGMCEFVKENFQEASEFSLAGAFETEAVELSIDYPAHIVMADGALTLEDILLKVQIKGIDSAIFIQASLRLAKPPLLFTGKNL